MAVYRLIPSTSTLQPEPESNPMPTETTETTETVLASMLTENTGRAICDSGGANGRHWQRNKGRDFGAEPETTLRFSSYSPSGEAPRADIEITHNVYHWLASRLTFDAERDAAFSAHCEAEGLYGDLEGMQSYIASLGSEATGLYGDGDPMTVNTYNGECLLSQVLQYIYWHDEENGCDYVLLQIHGGADVRGGYTDARVFEVTGDECAMFDNARASICPDTDDPFLARPATPPFPGMVAQTVDRADFAEDVRWYSDNGCTLTAEPATWPALGDYSDLGDYPIVLFEDGLSEDGRALAEVRGTGVLCIDCDGVGYCPHSGARLVGYTY